MKCYSVYKHVYLEVTIKRFTADPFKYLKLRLFKKSKVSFIGEEGISDENWDLREMFMRKCID